MLGRNKLSEKLILLTISFVLLAEAVIFIPSLANYRQDWLEERANSAILLSTAIKGVPNYESSKALNDIYMWKTGAVMVSVDREGMSEMLLGMPPDKPIINVIDLNEAHMFSPVLPALDSLFNERDGLIRVIAKNPLPDMGRIEYLVPQAVLHDAMVDYFRNILGLSLVIAFITGLLIYLALSAMIVRPVRQLAKQLIRFRDDPLTQYNFGPPSRRTDEIGDLEREFRSMKRDVRSSFRQRDRLAMLGLAVAKIQHDLRNILNAAQLVSDRIAMDSDERVASMGQRLERVIDRGIRIATDTLNYTRQEPGEVDREPIRIATLLGEIAADTLGSFEGLRFVNRVPTDLSVLADADNTYRLFHNLFRNAGQAMDTLPDDRAKELSLNAHVQGEQVFIHVCDTGPGLPNKTKDNLFTPFAAASSGSGSTGLGLTISHDLAVAQGGALDLVKSDQDGTEFRVTLPLLSEQRTLQARTMSTVN